MQKAFKRLVFFKTTCINVYVFINWFSSIDNQFLNLVIAFGGILFLSNDAFCSLEIHDVEDGSQNLQCRYKESSPALNYEISNEIKRTLTYESY